MTRRLFTFMLPATVVVAEEEKRKPIRLMWLPWVDPFYGVAKGIQVMVEIPKRYQVFRITGMTDEKKERGGIEINLPKREGQEFSNLVMLGFKKWPIEVGFEIEVWELGEPVVSVMKEARAGGKYDG